MNALSVLDEAPNGTIAHPTACASQPRSRRMVQGFVGRGVAVGAGGSCLDARGCSDADLAEGSRRSSMAGLAGRTVRAAKVVVS